MVETKCKILMELLCEYADGQSSVVRDKIKEVQLCVLVDLYGDAVEKMDKEAT